MMNRNIVANIAGRALGIGTAYLLIPFYLQILGPEAYGLVGFFATLSGVLAFADLGLTATLNREIARLTALNDSKQAQADLVRTYECVYAGIAIFLIVLIWLLAPLIAQRWLRSDVLGEDKISAVVRVMAVSIALQLPINLYLGGLMGLQKQILMNSLQSGWSIVRGGSTILILWLVVPTIEAFFWTQLACNIVYCRVVRTVLLRAAALARCRARFSWSVMRSTHRYALGMAAMALLSTALMQTDKLAVSKILALNLFGYYMLATTVAGAPRIIASSIGVAAFPRFTCLVAGGAGSALSKLYLRTSELIALAVIPGGLTLVCFAGDFLFAWTGNAVVASEAARTAALLTLGEMMQALSIPAYYLVLAHGNVRLNLQMGAASVAVITPLLIFLVKTQGLVGAGASWLILNIITFPIYVYIVNRRFMPNHLGLWCWKGLFRPLLLSLPCVLAARFVLPPSESRFSAIAAIAVAWSAASIAVAFTTVEIRSHLLIRVSKYLRACHGT